MRVIGGRYSSHCLFTLPLCLLSGGRLTASCGRKDAPVGTPCCVYVRKRRARPTAVVSADPPRYQSCGKYINDLAMETWGQTSSQGDAVQTQLEKDVYLRVGKEESVPCNLHIYCICLLF